MLDLMNVTILVAAGLVTLSALTSLLSQKVGAPLLLVFLAIGLLAGEDGLLGIHFDDNGAAFFIGSVALGVILFDSGFDTSFRSFRVAGAPALTLATVGVVLTAALVGVAAHLLFPLTWVEALLLGAIVASTDAAAVFFLLRVGGIEIRERVRATLEIESGSNDPMAIFLTATLVELAAAAQRGENGLGLAVVWDFLLQVGLGLGLGVLGGLVISVVLDRLRDLEAGLYPIVALSVALMLFAATALMGGSGFVAAYVAGVVAGNQRLRYAHRVRQFQTGMTWLAQIAMFLTLGLLATPSEFAAVAVPATVFALILIFVARPVAVWLCLLPFRFSAREKLFVSWVGLRGAVSILLAILPALAGVRGGDLFFNVVFILVLASLLIQGWTIAPAARRLRLLVAPRPSIVDEAEVELPGPAEMEMVGTRVHARSSAAVGDPVPKWAKPLLVMRDGTALTPEQAGKLKQNDQVYLFAAPGQVPLLERIYAAPAGYHHPELTGDFILHADTTVQELAAVYGVEPDGTVEGTLGELLTTEFLGQPGVGDRMVFGSVDLVVREVDEAGRVVEVGVVLEPPVRGPAATARRAIEKLREG